MHRTADGLWAGVYYDTLSACTFDLGCEHDNYHDLFRSVDIDDGDLDYYLMVVTRRRTWSRSSFS